MVSIIAIIPLAALYHVQNLSGEWGSAFPSGWYQWSTVGVSLLVPA